LSYVLINTCYPYSFFFTHPATPALYTLSLHDALPISPYCYSVFTKSVRAATSELFRYFPRRVTPWWIIGTDDAIPVRKSEFRKLDRKSTRLNSSHLGISYAVFCLKKKRIL